MNATIVLLTMLLFIRLRNPWLCDFFKYFYANLANYSRLPDLLVPSLQSLHKVSPRLGLTCPNLNTDDGISDSYFRGASAYFFLDMTLESYPPSTEQAHTLPLPGGMTKMSVEHSRTLSKA